MRERRELSKYGDEKFFPRHERFAREMSDSPLKSTMNETCRWIDMFETLCARYRCRSVETLARCCRLKEGGSGCGSSDEDVLFISGPSGKWLAEITSVALTRQQNVVVRLSDSSKMAVHEIANSYERHQMRGRASLPLSKDVDYEIILDWFAFRSAGVSSILTLTSSRESRQCLMRIDRNNRMIVLLITGNTTKVQELSSISCNPLDPSCLRPFPFILACELTVREVAYENLNLYQEAFIQIPPHCWLTKARELYKRAKWLRVTRYDGEAELRDRILCRRTDVTSVRLAWRDGYIFRNTSDSDSWLASQQRLAAHLLPVSAVIDLSVLTRDVKRDERFVLSLCDFDVFTRRCERNLASNIIRGDETDDVASYELGAAVSHGSGEERKRRRDDSIYESRYFVNADNELVSRRFVTLS